MDNSHAYHFDPPKQRISNNELAIQMQCLDMVAKLFPRTRVAAVPNGGKRTIWQQMQAKREGMSKGFVDLILVGSDAAGLPLVAFVEIKATSQASTEQKNWLAFMIDCRHKCGVFRSDVTLEAKLREWGFR